MRNALNAYLALASGVTDITRQTAVAAAKALVSQGEATAEQVGSLAEDLLAQTRQNREAVSALVRSEVDRALARVGLGSAEEVAALSQQVRELEGQLRSAAAVAALQASGAGAAAAPAPSPEEVGDRAAQPPAKKAPTKRAPAKKAPAKKTPAKRAPGKKAPTKRDTAGKTPEKKSTAKKAPTKRDTAEKTPEKKSTAKKAPAKRGPAKKAPAKAIEAPEPKAATASDTDPRPEAGESPA